MRAVIKSALAEPLSDHERALFLKLCGGREPPTDSVRTLAIVAGRGSGKTQCMAALVIYLALFRHWRVAPGQVPVVLLLAADKWQAGIAFSFIAGQLDAAPTLAQEIESRTKDTITLRNGVRIEVAASDFRGVRGCSPIVVIADEIALWLANETSASPAQEVIAAVEPGLARFPNSMLVCISTPFNRAGPLYDLETKHYGSNNAHTLVARGGTLDFNSTFDAELIERKLREDRPRFAAEFLAEWRDDISGALLGQWIDDAIDTGVTQREPLSHLNGGTLAYVGYVDPSGGSGSDSYTCAISHAEGDIAVLDAVLEIRPPYNTEVASEAVATLCRRYRIASVRGDRFAGDWPREALGRYGIGYVTADHTASDTYHESLALFSAGRVRLLDHSRLLMQLRSLQRRVRTGGRDQITHPPNGHDDISNAACGALLAAATRQQGLDLSLLQGFPSTIFGGISMLAPARDSETISWELNRLTWRR